MHLLCARYLPCLFYMTDAPYILPPPATELPFFLFPFH